MSRTIQIPKLVLSFSMVMAAFACVPTPDEGTQDILIQPWVGWITAGEIVGSSDDPVQVSLMTPSASPVATQPLYGTPTPDPFREIPPLREEEVTHIVQWGDSLSTIAAQYQISPLTITQANGLINGNFLQAGQYLRIPPPEPNPPGPSFKIIPDSDLVNGPAGINFDIYGDVANHAGYLLFYSEEVEGYNRSGAAIVDLVARRYSINPRLLLAVLEYQSGWLRNVSPRPETLVFPMGYSTYGWEGLFSQLSWAADQLFSN